MTQLPRVTSRVVNGDIRNGQASSTVNGKGLNWSVENVQAGDGGVSGQAVSVEELGLGLSSVGALSVPPLGTIAIQRVSRSAGYSNVFS